MEADVWKQTSIRDRHADKQRLKDEFRQRKEPCTEGCRWLLKAENGDGTQFPLGVYRCNNPNDTWPLAHKTHFEFLTSITLR